MNLRINFWVKESGNLMTHSSGLSQEQVDSLHSLKVGDRLMIWQEKERVKETDPHYVMRLYTPKTISTPVPTLTAAPVKTSSSFRKPVSNG